ncbi:MAG TPA: YigZ family protein [Paludibacter sp.]|nr:YigZ family protein [Paludibacter sp.]
MNSYKTITSKAEGIYREKGSKFLSFALPVSDKEEIHLILKEYRSRFFDARHVCYAWMLGPDRLDFRANDDGEPSGTAGRPILGQINSHDLTNVLIIVVRYFGGILLGTGGLITAYKQAASDAINNSEIVEKTVQVTLCIHFEYLLLNDVMRIVKETNAQILKQEFDNKCTVILSFPKNDELLIKARFENLFGVTCE